MEEATRRTLSRHLTVVSIIMKENREQQAVYRKRGEKNERHPSCIPTQIRILDKKNQRRSTRKYRLAHQGYQHQILTKKQGSGIAQQRSQRIIQK
jgi:hypothetical protein